MLEYYPAVAGYVLAVANAGLCLPQQVRQCCLSLAQRQSARVCSVDRQQVECISIGDLIVATPLQAVEIGDAVVTIAAALGVDDGVIDIKPADILDDPRKPSCLISCTQPSATGARSARVGRQGSMKESGASGDRLRGTLLRHGTMPANIVLRCGLGSAEINILLTLLKHPCR